MNLLLNLCFVGERDRSKVDLPRFHRVVVFGFNIELHSRNSMLKSEAIVAR